MGRPPSPLTLPRLLPGKYEGVWSVDRTKGDVFLEINPLSVAAFAIIFSHSEGCLFDEKWL